MWTEVLGKSTLESAGMLASPGVMLVSKQARMTRCYLTINCRLIKIITILITLNKKKNINRN